VYYLADGRVVNVDGKQFGAPTTYALTSFAVARVGGPDLRLAGTVGTGPNADLVVGTFSGGVHPTAVRGKLSRPAWAPRLDEVWVGRGTALYRVDLRGNAAAVQLSSTNGAVRGQIAAVRFSPDGARVALVMTTDGASQIWIGSVSRTPQSAQVGVDGLEPISPEGVTVTDVAWNDQLNLFAVGRDTATGVPSVYEVHVDGSLWTSRGIGNLPQAPDSITVAENEVAWVSAGGTVWAQAAGSWVSPGQGETRGENPVYLE
jgi:dipeptidyl aminopeptidase/acylaminoacyl peptidase